MNTCQDCKTKFDLSEGGFIWNELVFCELCDPEQKEDSMEEDPTKKAFIEGYFAGMDDRYTNNTAYSNGFRAGQRHEREYLLTFVEDHEGFGLKVEDVVKEIEGRYTVEMNQYLKGIN
jgi:hypothetical protein